MKAEAWAVVAFAAVVAAVAWRFARRSRLALAVALLATTLAASGLAFAALGYGGCSQRGDCGAFGGALRTTLVIETVLLPVLVLFALARAAWRRPAHEGRSRPRAQGDAPRMRLRDAALAIGGTICALLSLVLIFSGHGDERIGGVTCLLFSVALLLVPISGRLAARSGLRPRLERIQHDGALQPALVIPGSKAKLHMMRVACLCFAGVGLLMAIWPLATTTWSRDEVRVVGIVCAALFGGVGVTGTLLARGPARIELLPGGMRWQLGAAPSYVAWDDVTGASAYDIRSSWFLAIDARPGGLRIPPRQRWIARANRAIANADASIPLEAFPVEPERLADVVAACAADPERRREIGAGPSLDWLAGDAAHMDPDNVDLQPSITAR